MTPPPDSSEPARHDPYAALRVSNYRRFFIGHVLSVFGFQMQSVAVGWELYLRTDSKLILGLVGLIQFLPVLCLALVAGHVADRFNRKHIVMLSAGVISLSALGLAAISHTQADYRWMFLCLLLTGAARAFLQPAKASLVPLIVPAAQFPNAITWNTSGFHFSAALGPAVGGFLVAWTDWPALVYLLDAVAALSLVTALYFVKSEPMPPSTGSLALRDMLAGARYLKSQQVVFAAILLDMFAVLLGGATTLLPVFAKDILHADATGLGWMRAAPAVGALMMGLTLAHLPPIQRAGRALLWSVVGFGLTTIVFGLSQWVELSLVMLFLGGAFDNISVVIRHTLVQRLTPDELRGRVSAVNGLFIGASNELGGFESGVVAEYLGPVVSVVSGGIGTLLVVAAMAVRAPQLRAFGRL